MVPIECFPSRGQHLCKFIGTKESICIRKEINSQRTGLRHRHGRRFIVLGHQYGRRDVMRKRSFSPGLISSSLRYVANNDLTFFTLFFFLLSPSPLYHLPPSLNPLSQDEASYQRVSRKTCTDLFAIGRTTVRKQHSTGKAGSRA